MLPGVVGFCSIYTRSSVMASFSARWTSDGTSSVSPVGGGGNRLPDEACGQKLPARIKSCEEKNNDKGKNFLVVDLDVWYLSEMYLVKHNLWSSGQFSALATIAGAPNGAVPHQLYGKTIYVTCEMRDKYINVSKIEARDANAQATPNPTVADTVPF